MTSPDLWQLATSYRISQALYVAARLGIVDLVKDGATSSTPARWP